MSDDWLNSPPSRRFISGFIASFLVSLSWVLSLCIEVSRCGAIARSLLPFWLINLPVYGVLCTLFWSTATGILLATIDKEIIGKTRLSSKALLLLVLLLLSFGIAMEDKLQPRVMQVYEVKELCTLAPSYLQIQNRIYNESLNCEQLNSEEKLFKESVTVDSIQELVVRSNLTAWAEVIVQGYYSLVIGLFIWYLLVVLARRRIIPEQTMRLSAVTVLFSIWIPFRTYQKYIQARLLECDVFSSSIITGGVLTMLLFGVLIVKRRKVDLGLVINIVGFFIALLAFVVGAVPLSLEFLADTMYRLRLSHFVALYLIGFAVLFLLGRYLVDYKYENNVLVHGLDISHLSSEQESFFEDVDNLIRKRLYENRVITPNELADELHIKRANFYAKFKEAFGIAPGKYIRLIRLKTAAELLENNYTSIAQVARKIGYRSQSQFSKAFKKQYGLAPSEYAKMKKQEQMGAFGQNNKENRQ